MDEQTFLDNDYERKINFLNAHFGRMWTKFNIFFTVESSLIGGKFLFSPDKAGINIGFAIFGTALSLVWYIVGAHEQYLVLVFQQAVKEAADKLTKLLTLTSYPDSQKDYHYVGDNKHPMVKRNFLRMQSSHSLDLESSIHLSSFFPFLMTVLWAIYLVYLLLGCNCLSNL